MRIPSITRLKKIHIILLLTVALLISCNIRQVNHSLFETISVNPFIPIINSVATKRDPTISCLHEIELEFDKSDINPNAIPSPLIFSTYFGGSELVDHVEMTDIAVDPDCNIYVTGYTGASDFPMTVNLTTDYNSSINCFVAKFNSTGNGLIYSTIIGGRSNDVGTSIYVDSMGNVYVSGWTDSNDFPCVNGYVSPDADGHDAFIIKLNATGNGLIYSSLIGGGFIFPYSGSRDLATSITVDEVGNAYVTGYTNSPTFPTTHGYDETYNGDVYVEHWDCFICQLNATGNGLVFSTYLGGILDDVSTSITLDRMGNVIISGYTESPDFPLMNPLDDTLNGSQDCFIAKLAPTGDSLLFSTFFGGNASDSAHSIDMSSSGAIIVCGETTSDDFTTSHAFASNIHGGVDSFLLAIDSEASSISFSTYLGGNSDDIAFALIADDHDGAYVAGMTYSLDFPTLNAYDSSHNGNRDVFVTKIDVVNGLLLYSTFVGGSHYDSTSSIYIDDLGFAYVTGLTGSDDFPHYNGYDDTLNGTSDSFIFKLGDMSDSDGDLIPDFNETVFDTNRFSNDTDHDSLDDYSELFIYGTSPVNSDTDSDSMSDSWELAHGLNPLDPQDASEDLDNDALSNAQEFLHHTDPNDPDSDMDSIPDGWEVINGFDPLNPLIPLNEFLLYNLPIILGIFVLGAALAGVGIYLSRPYLEKREKVKKERELEDEARKAVDELNQE